MIICRVCADRMCAHELWDQFVIPLDARRSVRTLIIVCSSAENARYEFYVVVCRANFALPILIIITIFIEH